MPKLAVRAPLTHLRNPQLPEQRLARLEDRRLSHGSCHFDGLSADEFAFESGLAFFEKHFDHFPKIGPQLVERLTLAVRSRKAWHPPNVQPRVGR